MRAARRKISVRQGPEMEAIFDFPLKSPEIPGSVVFINAALTRAVPPLLRSSLGRFLSEAGPVVSSPTTAEKSGGD